MPVIFGILVNRKILRKDHQLPFLDETEISIYKQMNCRQSLETS
jgi:hypothetical protein